eukprot:TRINITY_DN6170_c0_g1_i2.p1 TRINITY_DN6170_c0_g1~~TRINITY_DN6170_c0_g1_i2.p1  ORF type:complete len:169 (-),score=11.49 TRINITY_DN6170_c0_g1_i2:4-510(-)
MCIRDRAGDFFNQGVGVSRFALLALGGAQPGEFRRGFNFSQAVAERAGEQHAVAAVLVRPGQAAAGTLRCLAGHGHAQGEAALQRKIANLVAMLQWSRRRTGTAGQQACCEQQGKAETQGNSFLMAPARTSLSGLALLASLSSWRASSLRSSVHRTSLRWAAIPCTLR